MQPAQPPFVPGAPLPPYPSPADAAAAYDPELGTLVTELRAGMSLRAVFSVLILLCPGGLVTIGAAQDNELLMAISGAATLLLLFLVYYQQSGVRVRIYRDGVERAGRFGTKRVAWDRLESYRLNVVDSVAVAAAFTGLLGILIIRALAKNNAKLTPQAVIFTSNDGAKLSIGNDLKGYPALLDTLVPYLTERLFAPAKQAYDMGAPVAFGKRVSIQRGTGITVTSVFGKQNVLPFAELASAGMERAFLAIRKKDKSSPWQRVQAASVPNVHVFVRLAAVEQTGHESDRLPLAWTV